MLDNDNLTYSKPKRMDSAAPVPAAARTLLTTDRSQKLDLLIHLLTNLQQSLIVCGPEGIGKTTLLRAFQDSHKDVWSICLLQGSAGLSFEAIITQLSQFLNLSNTSIQFDMSSLRAFCGKQKVVLMIDDAEELVPGLIGELMDFSDSLSGLRLVFAMNYDEFKHKTGSDHSLDACHFIELPPLNQRQCMEYLQNLSSQPGAPFSFNAITDALVEDLYRQTQGIPGKLAPELPKLGQYHSRQTRKTGLAVGIALIVIAAGFVAKSLLPPTANEDTAADKQIESISTGNEQLPPLPETVTPQTPEPAADSGIDYQPEAPDTESSPAIPSNASDSTRPVEESPKTVEISKTADQAKTDAPPAAAEATEPPLPAVTQTQPAAEQIRQTDREPAQSEATVPSEKPATSATAEPGAGSDSDLDWIIAQPASNYTVQLMVLSSKTSVIRFIKKNPEYSDNLKYYTIERSGQEKYVVIYGSFQSAADALKRKSTMPNEFNQGLVKQFKHIQRESRRK